MSNSRPANRQRTPRRPAAYTSALTAGFLVLCVALIVVKSDGLRDFGRSIFDVDGTETQADMTGLRDPDASSSESEFTGVYIEGDVGFPETLNPLLVESPVERAVAAMLYRHVLATDEWGEPAPDLATEWSVSADGLVYTIELDPTARWHDGEPISARDVLFTIRLIKDAEFPGDPDLSNFWRAITVRKTGEHSAEFELLEPYAGFVGYLRIPVLPKHQLGNALPADLADSGLDGDIVGSGPYVLQSIDRDRGELRFSIAEAVEEPAFREVIFRYYDSREEAAMAFRDGELDGVSYVPLDFLHDGNMFPVGAKVYAHDLARYTALYFNVRHPYFRDVATRRAVEHAIDRTSLVDNVLGGYAAPGNSPIPEMFAAHEPGDHRKYDRGRAVELLEEEGWKLGANEEILQRNGEYFRVPMIVNNEDPQRVAAAAEIRDQLLKVGIALDVQALPENEVQHALSTRQFAAAMFGWHTTNGNLDLFQVWHSSQADNGANFTGFADSEADELLLSARRMSSLEERNEHYARFQVIFAEQVPAVVLFYPRYHFAVSERVQGAAPKPLVDPGDRVRQFPQWYELEPSASGERETIAAIWSE